jgi:hypothetical protein
MDSEETGPVEDQTMPRYTDAQLPIVALLLDSIEASETRSYIDALGLFSQALNTDPVWAMGTVIGLLRGGVHALAQCRGETFAETLAVMRMRSAG